MPTEFPNLIREANVSVPLGEIKPHPQNWRTHSEGQMAATRQSVERGTAGNILVNRRTGHIINGHMRYELAQAEGHDTVVVDYIDVDSETERRLLATLDTVPMLADIDVGTLADLTADIEMGAEELDILLEGLIGDIPPSLGESLRRGDRLYSDNRPETRGGDSDHLPIEHTCHYVCAHCGKAMP